MFEEISKYPSLREDQRIDARKQARTNLMADLGGEPLFEEFEQRQIKELSDGVNLAIHLLVWAALLAAFVTSGYHVFTSARESYGAGIGDPQAQIVAGFSFVILAEFSALIFSALPGLLDMPGKLRGVLYLLAGTSAAVAMIGNIAASIQFRANPFDWFLQWWHSLAVDPMLWAIATVPPTVVLGLGVVEKHVILKDAKRRHRATQEYEQALATWRRTVSHLETHPLWLESYKRTLWDVWRKGKRRDVLAQVTTEERRLIVEREIEAEFWFRSSGGIPRNSTESRNARRMNSGGLVDSVEGSMTQAEKVKHILAERPDLLELPKSEAAEQLGVGISTLYKGLELYQNNGNSHHSNGHKEDVS